MSHNLTSCCSTFGEAAEQQFNEKKAIEELTQYRQKGPGPTTRLLQDALAQAGVLNGDLLDIGSGIGSLTFELMDRGMASATAVDASSAYLAAAVEEAERRGYSQRLRFVHGDFVTLAPEIPPACVVTLDRVICCYPSFAPLLEEALAHAERWFAFSYPRDVWYVRAAGVVENGRRRLAGNAFRTFVHPATTMERVISEAGFELVSRNDTWTWSVDVYGRLGGKRQNVVGMAGFEPTTP